MASIRPLIRPWTSADRETLLEMVERGKSKAAISARLKRSMSSIDREARQLGLTLRKQKAAFTLAELDDQAVGRWPSGPAATSRSKPGAP